MNNLLEVPVHNLVRGMYIADLDIPWLDTPFAVQGFYVYTDEDILKLAEHCSVVYVDPRRTTPSPPEPTDERTVYTDAVSMREEFLQAEADFESVSETVSRTFERLAAGGGLDLVSLETAIVPMIDSVLRNNDALAALVRLKKKDGYGYSHSIATAVWASILGRHVGLDRQTLKNLALGASLIDIGKIRVPDEILNKTSALTPEETVTMRQHVQHGLDMLEDADGVGFEIRLIVEAHHERHDGSGYPNGLAGINIPLEARIAGIADSYDAMITDRPYAKAHTSFDAMQELTDLKGIKYQEPLIEQFMQAIGLFPTGAIVELNTGEVGIVVAQNPSRRLKPKVVVVLDRHKRRIRDFPMVDLAGFAMSDDPPQWITRELEPGAHGIDASEFYL